MSRSAVRARAGLRAVVDRIAASTKQERIAALIAAGLIVLLVVIEGLGRDLLIALGVTVSLTAALMWLSRKVLTPLVAMALMLALVVGISHTKSDLFGVKLHSYDIYQFLLQWNNVVYLSSVAPRQFWLGLAALIGMVALIVRLVRIDQTRVSRVAPAIAVALGLGLVQFAQHTLLIPEMQLGVSSGRHISNFYVSWPQTVSAYRNGHILAASPARPGPLTALAPQTSCRMETRHKPPHIILIHQESMVPPAYFAGLKYDQQLDHLFQSDDGKTRRLRVEAYKGGSWLTQLSVLTGLSTRAFGDMRFYLLNFLRDKVAESLPRQLKLCGYDTFFQSVSPGATMHFRQFFLSIGFNAYYDRKAQGTDRYAERDAFYYNNYFRYFQERRASGAPTFALIETIASHWPYDFTFAPEMAVPGGAPGSHPEVHEYLRRMSLAAMDYKAFLERLKREYPDERFLIVSYGDHRPGVNRYLDPEFAARLAGIIRTQYGFDDEPFVTYYAVRGQNVVLPRLPAHETLDVVYLPPMILKLAGVAPSGAMEERLRLMQLCGGAYMGCPDKTAILDFHRRLLDGGIVKK